MPTPNVLQHTISAELRYQLVQTALDIEQAEGGHERMILTEQYDTLARFLSNPEATLPAPAYLPGRDPAAYVVWPRRSGKSQLPIIVPPRVEL